MNFIACFAIFLLLMFCAEATQRARPTMTLERPGVMSKRCVEFKDKQGNVIRKAECDQHLFAGKLKPAFQWCNTGNRNEDWDYCTDPCPAPYTKVGLRCLHLGIKLPSGLRQNEAELECQAINGNLAEITPAELTTVIEFLEKKDPDGSLAKAWVAPSEEGHNGYHWKFNRKLYHIAPIFPKKMKTSEFEGCMTLRVEKRGYMAERCTAKSRTYICQRNSRTLARPGVNSKPCVERREKLFKPAECGKHYSENIVPQYEWCWVGLGPHDWDYCTDPCVDVRRANGVSDSGNRVFRQSHVCNDCTTDGKALAFAKWRNPTNKDSTTVFIPYRHSANNGFTRVAIKFNFVEHTCNMITPVIAWDCPTKYENNKLVWSHCTEISKNDAYCTVNHEPHYLGHFLRKTLNCQHNI